MKWGVVVTIVSIVCEYSAVYTVMALRSSRYAQWSSRIDRIGDIFAFVYDIIGIPVMWITPQSFFNNWFWIRLIIGLFWGVVLTATGLLLGALLRPLLHPFALWVLRCQKRNHYTS